MKLSGQHEGMLVVRDGGTVEVVDTIDLGFPAALTDDIADFIQHTTVRLQPGDGVVLYTDGVTEAEDVAGQQYGLARLCTLVSQHWTAVCRDDQGTRGDGCASAYRSADDV